MPEKLDSLMSRQEQTAGRTVKFKRNGSPGLLHLLDNRPPIPSKAR
jgi:hypothetical protein